MMTRPVFWRQALAAILSWAVACPVWGEFRPSSAQTGSVPVGILYQGRLEKDELPVSETKDMTFSLYTVPTGGIPLWTSGVSTVAVLGGAFMVYLNIPDGYLLFGTTKYLEITVNDVPPVILAPRDPVRSVPYAKVAETVEGTLDIATGGLKLTSQAGDALVISSDTGRVGMGTTPGVANSRLEIRPIASDGSALYVAGPTGTKILTVNDPAGTGALQLTTPLSSSFGGTGTNLGGVSAGAIAYFPGVGSLGGSAAGADSSRILCSGGTGAPTWCAFDSANTPGTLVARDGSGNFSAGTITGSLTGPLTGTAALATNLANGSANSIPYQTGVGATAFVAAGANGNVLSLNGAGTPAWAAPSGLPAATAVDLAGGGVGQLPYQNALNDTMFLPAGTAGQILASGGAAAPVWTNQSALTAGTAAAWAANPSNCAAGLSPLGADAAGVVETCSDVATQAELDAHATASAVHGATTGNTADTIVRRGPTGNFSAGTITATLDGPASTATSLAGNGTDCGAGNAPLGVDASGNAEGCYDVATQAELAPHLALTGSSAHGAVSGNTASTLVLRDASGNFSAGTITAALNGNAPTASAWAANPSNCAAGWAPLGVDASGVVTGCYDTATQTELGDHAALTDAHGAASANTASAIVLRTAGGNFSAGTVTASLTGNASTASALAANGSNCAAGQSPDGVTSAGAADNCIAMALEADRTTHAALAGTAHGAASANTASAIVARTAAGAFSAGTITAALSGNASLASAWAANGSNCVTAGDAMMGVNAAGAAETCTDVVTQTEGNNHMTLTSAHGATSANTASAIVARDASGMFSANSMTLTNFIGLPVTDRVTLENLFPAAVGQVVRCSNCLNSVNVVVSTGTGKCQIATLGAKGTAWH